MADGAKFSFSLVAGDPSGARCGLLATPHGPVATPAFICCGTRGAVKGLTAEQVRRCGTQILLANTYHLSLQPGAETVAELGGLHRMMDWPGPMLTDSGGFQIFSLGHGGVAREIKSCRGPGMGPRTLLQIDEAGALFRSYGDGSRRLLTPESAMQIQRLLGADLVLPLDECTPFHADRAYTARATARSHRWELRSLAAFRRGADGDGQAIYGIVQGGVYEDLRRESCAFVGENDFFGQAIGGSLGGSREQMWEIVELVGKWKHPARPTHLLGIGGLHDILHGVGCGVDTFDCVHPTRLARHGGALVPAAFSAAGHWNLKNARFARDPEPIDGDCPCHACRTASRGYLHHLFHAGEILGGQLLTIHNLTFLNRFLDAIRTAICAGQWSRFRRENPWTGRAS
ncbi:MAG: tRNA guanosine(34) transglycosylase Tgt [Puniceicoccales bacterium]|jgi:queuine tRNA-ribosyltransferase|nr:tRNA guanosine(34) transglycosylase Tgt [Puniceicoccales bacterium]